MTAQTSECGDAAEVANPTFAHQEVAFATLKPTFSDAAGQLVVVMRATLQGAQDIATAVGEAERTAQRCKNIVQDVDSATTERESQLVHSELYRLAQRAYVNRLDDPVMRNRPSRPNSPVNGDRGAADGTTSASSSLVPTCVSTKPISEQMALETETTVMWVQQLLESVHFIGSDKALEPGSSLLSMVQPKPKHDKDYAMHRSLVLFNEKKESEKNVDELAAIFRHKALSAVAAQRSAVTPGPPQINIAQPI